jgi:Ssp1 endopeptidase immunity protein Rap1a
MSLPPCGKACFGNPCGKACFGNPCANIAATVLILLATTGRANGQTVEATTGFVDGNGLYAMCTSNKSVDRVQCISYVEAILDAGTAEAIFTLEVQQGGKGSAYPSIAGFRWCSSDKITAGQAADVVTKFLRDNPKNRHNGAAYLVAHAMTDAFPCGR